jgi:glycine/D-amino acid oxidase-like deaminating enzyme
MKPQLEFGAQIGVAAQDARHRGRACARAEPRAGVPPCADVAGRRLALQSADGDARLCGALRGARRRVHQRATRARCIAPTAIGASTPTRAIDAENVVVALGPWAPDVLEPLGIKVPLGIKRGYHRHYDPKGNASLSRP